MNINDEEIKTHIQNIIVELRDTHNTDIVYLGLGKTFLIENSPNYGERLQGWSFRDSDLNNPNIRTREILSYKKRLMGLTPYRLYFTTADSYIAKINHKVNVLCRKIQL